MAKKLIEIRNNDGRVFFIGVGGSAGNASHAVNDFRKLCGLNVIVLQIMYLNLLQEKMMKG